MTYRISKGDRLSWYYHFDESGTQKTCWHPLPIGCRLSSTKKGSFKWLTLEMLMKLRLRIGSVMLPKEKLKKQDKSRDMWGCFRWRETRSNHYQYRWAGGNHWTLIQNIRNSCNWLAKGFTGDVQSVIDRHASMRDDVKALKDDVQYAMSRQAL